MKKKLTSILMVLILLTVANVGYVKGEITDEYGEKWEGMCKYVDDYSNVIIYYKGTQTALKASDSLYKDDNGNQLYIKNNGEPVQYFEVLTFEVANNITINSQEGCPKTIYKNYRGNSNLSVSEYSTVEDKANIIEKIFSGKGTKRYDLTRDSKPSEPSKSTSDNRTPCEKLIDTSTQQLIDKYLGYIHIIVPIMVLALGTYDMFKAVISSKEDEMKKSQKRFVIRLVAGVLVFLAPTIVNIIIDILNKGVCPIN